MDIETRIRIRSRNNTPDYKYSVGKWVKEQIPIIWKPIAIWYVNMKEYGVDCNWPIENITFMLEDLKHSIRVLIAAIQSEIVNKNLYNLDEQNRTFALTSVGHRILIIQLIFCY